MTLLQRRDNNNRITDMKLARFRTGDREGIGIVQDNEILDCSDAGEGLGTIPDILQAGEEGRRSQLRQDL